MPKTSKLYLILFACIAVGVALLLGGVLGSTGFLDERRVNNPYIFWILIVGLPIGVPILILVIRHFITRSKNS